MMLTTPKKHTRIGRHLIKMLEGFWRRWKKEYLLELREFHRIQVQGRTTYNFRKGEIVIVYDEGHPEGYGGLGELKM